MLGDDNPRWRPDHFEESLWGCRKSFHYPVIKLLDYRRRWAELATSANPFAVMVMAHLNTRATRHDPATRRIRKFELVKNLYERGLARQDILELFNFIDWLLALPEDLERAFQDDLTRYEATMGKPYITAIERSGFERGMQQGEANLLRQLLQQRFDPLPEAVLARLGAATPAELERWGGRLLEAGSLDEVFAP